MRSSLPLMLSLAACGSPEAADVPPTVSLEKIIERSRPGAAHQALQPLVGTWRVEKRVFNALGTPDNPARSEGMVTRRDWMGNGNFLRDVTTGKINGQPYERIGFLGYNPMDKRYEWNTADNVTTIMMTYHGATGAGPAMPIDMRGTFTDLGVTGEANVGKPIATRTRMTVIDADHHRFELFFRAPEGEEMLADRMDFTRIDPVP